METSKSLISPEYLELQQGLHEREDYGTSSVHMAPIVSAIINKMGVTEVLDYGAGKCTLAPALRVDHHIKVYPYDPAIEKLSKTPNPREMVVCTDVLEHIEPDLLENVLDDLKRVTLKIGYFSIATGPAIKLLPDGSNAHLIQEGSDFWLPKIMERFDIQNFIDTGTNLNITVYSNVDK